MDTKAPAGFSPLLRSPEEARTLNAAGVTIRLLRRPGGQFSLLDYTAPPGFAGPAPHWHQHTTEVFYALEGSIVLRVGEQTHTLGRGAVALVPPGVVHAFQNPGTEPARFLVQASPGGLEGYFVEVVELIRTAPTWPPADMRPLEDLARRYDTLPPPARAVAPRYDLADLLSQVRPENLHAETDTGVQRLA